MPGPVLEFWFEFASTYSHVAAQRIDAVARSSGVSIRWRPFLLGPIFKAQGWNDSPFNIYEAKGAYMWRDVERLSEKYSVPFHKPSAFPQNGLLAARAATAGESEIWQPEFVRGVYHANFADDRDISDAGVVRGALERSGCPDPDEFLARAETSDVKERLRARTSEAIRRGIFGAPSFLVESELFWGNDRLEDAIEWCLRR